MTTLERVEDCFFTAIAVLAEHATGGTCDARDGVTLAAVGIGGTEFNLAQVRTPPRSASGALAWVAEVMASIGSPWMLRVRDDHVAGLADAIGAAGLALEKVLPAMWLNVPGVAPPLPPGLRIERVVDAGGLAVFADAAARGFGAPKAWDQPFAPTLVDDPRIAFLNGFVDGADRPQATGVGVIDGDLVGVFAITSQAEVRGRGIGSAMTWAAMAAGAAGGATTAVLQASAMGEPVYRRMGYATIAEHHHFVPAKA